MPLTRVSPLLAPTARAMSWTPLAVTAAAGAAFIGGYAHRRGATEEEVIRALRMAAIVLATGVAGVLDDPSDTTVASCPLRLSSRRLTRLGLWLPLAALAWSALLWLAGLAPALLQPLAWWRLTAETVALAAIGLAAAAVTIRFDPHGRGSLAVAPAVLGFVWLTFLAPEPLRPWTDPRDPLAGPASLRLWVAILSVAVVVVVVTSRDPGRRGRPGVRSEPLLWDAYLTQRPVRVHKHRRTAAPLGKADRSEGRGRQLRQG
ncbi:MAG: hypothetical protein M3387_05730 [Actinomycetota bacterium]|nr:hypothetical protein [Actinomycetota bacterium]